MRTINFIDSETPEQLQSLHRWFRITMIATSLILSSIIFITTWQLYHLYSNKKQHKNMAQHAAPFIPILQQKSSLEANLTTLSTKANQIKRLGSKTKRQFSCLKAIHKICTTPIILKSLKLSEGPEEVILFSPTLEAATLHLEALKKECGFDNLAITFLEPSPQKKGGFVIHIKQSIKWR